MPETLRRRGVTFKKNKRLALLFRSFALIPALLWWGSIELHEFETILEERDLKISFLSKGTNVRVENKLIHQDIFLDEISTSKAHEIATTIQHEMNRYPSDCLQRIGLNTVIIGSNLRIDGKSFAGCSFLENVIIGTKNESYKNIRRIFHHEVFHLLLVKNESWSQFELWPKGEKAEDFPSSLAYDSQLEDIAESFSLFMENRENILPSHTLRKKMEIVRDEFIRFCPQFQVKEKENFHAREERPNPGWIH
jgi:hypothetical protein